MHPKGFRVAQITHLVVDDAPGVRHKLIKLPRKCVVPRARRAEGVAFDVQVSAFRHGLAYVDRRQRCEGASQAVPCQPQRYE